MRGRKRRRIIQKITLPKGYARIKEIEAEIEEHTVLLNAIVPTNGASSLAFHLKISYIHYLQMTAKANKGHKVRELWR
jgi:hypothetical protein